MTESRPGSMTACAGRSRASAGLRVVATRLAIASTVVLLWSAPQLASQLSDHNRHYFMWERVDAAWLLLPILVWACLAVLISLLVDCSGRLWIKRAFHSVFLLVCGGGVLTVLVHHLAKLRPYRSPLLGVAEHFGWLVLAVLAGYALRQDRSRIVGMARTACLIGSPATLLFAIQLVLGPSYPQRMDCLPIASDGSGGADGLRVRAETLAPDVRLASSALPPRDAAEARPSVYWFIFDEWSYERTYRGSDWPDRFPNLNRLCRQSVVFHNARAQGTRTEVCVPAMLYGSQLRPVFERGRMGFRSGDELIPADRLESVLSKAGKLGYYRALVGFGLPYSQWVGRDLELCRSYRFFPHARGLPAALKAHATQVAQRSAEPLMKYLVERWLQGAPYMPYYRQLHIDMRKDVEWLLTQSPPRTFAVIHYILPHKPYLFDAQGNELPLNPSMTVETEEAYERHLSCMDIRLGEFLDALDASGRLDESLIIVTADHAWRADPLRRSGLHPVEHVPLIVKLPQRSETLAVHSPFPMHRIAALIEHCLRAEPTARGLAAWVEQCGSESPAASGQPVARLEH